MWISLSLETLGCLLLWDIRSVTVVEHDCTEPAIPSAIQEACEERSEMACRVLTVLGMNASAVLVVALWLDRANIWQW